MPNHLKSVFGAATAIATLACAGAALSAPVIASIPIPPATGCLQKGTIFSIIGTGFGTPAGKGASLGGSGINIDLPIKAWFPTTVRATLPNDPKIKAAKPYYVGLKLSNGDWISNLVNVKICP